jgi:preprotein translocase subunit YajC
MKKLYIIAFVIIFGVILYFYYTRPLTKHFYYPFNEKNNSIIKDVYSKGKVSCGGGFCLQIDTIIQTNSKYIIKGGPQLRLYNMNLYVQKEKGGKEFEVVLPNRSLVFRNAEYGQLFLDEITTQLFLNNDQSISNHLEEFRNKKE